MRRWPALPAWVKEVSAMNFKKQFKDGLLDKNPVFVQLLGMCSTLAITTSLFNGLGMGAAVTIITICSNVLISALRKVIPNQIRIAAYITIIAGFVTVVDLLLKAYIPALSESLGVYIALSRAFAIVARYSSSISLQRT